MKRWQIKKGTEKTKQMKDNDIDVQVIQKEEITDKTIRIKRK